MRERAPDEGRAPGLLRFVSGEVCSYALHQMLVGRAASVASPGPEPVVLFVHGHFGGAGTFALLERSLRRRGFTRFAGWGYRSRGTIAAVAAELGAFVARELPATPLWIVAHSLGGIVARWWLQEQGGAARALVTLSTPHHGVRWLPGAGFVPLIRELAPGSELLGTLDRGAARLSDVPCLSIVSRRDHLIHAEHAGFPAARFVAVAHAGHVGVLFSRRVHALVAEHLAGVR